MYLSPLGENIDKIVIRECFAIMDEINQDKQISRIENIEEEYIKNYADFGLLTREKFPDYIYLRTDLADLKGDKFKSKRCSYNYFLKHYKYEYTGYNPPCKDACIKICQIWMKNRKKINSDVIYQGMLDDTYLCQLQLMEYFSQLNITGRVIKINHEIVAYTFGYELNPLIFCVQFEAYDINFRGISQFIFRNFCRDLNKYKYINTMDDSGLINLSKVKLSYRPVKTILNYIATKF